LGSLFAIGTFALILGAVLLVPGLWWARRKARANPNVPAGMKVTATGFILAGAVAVVVVGGLSAQYWASDTAFGQWMTTSTGRLLFVSVTVGVALVAELLLNLAGFRLIALREPRDV